MLVTSAFISNGALQTLARVSGASKPSGWQPGDRCGDRFDGQGG
jgi:hypothetical protein